MKPNNHLGKKKKDKNFVTFLKPTYSEYDRNSSIELRMPWRKNLIHLKLEEN